MSTDNSVKTLVIKIGELWGSSEGISQKFELDAPIEIEADEFEVKSNVTVDVHLIKLKNEISVLLSNLEIKVKSQCQRCLKKFESTINIQEAERQFLTQKPPKESDIMDIFLIDMEKMSVDLTDMIRQEIILHFPLISVCSKSCKGMCQRCGADLNKLGKKDCGHAREAEKHEKDNRPFKNLKKLLK